VRGPQCRRARRARLEQVPTQVTYPGHVWTYDIVHYACWNGTKLKVLPVVDEFTRECLALEVATSLPAARVIAMLARRHRGVEGVRCALALVRNHDDLASGDGAL
jgi:putative transposase